MASSEVQRTAGARRPLTASQEKFAQGIFEGLTAPAAYRRAYGAENYGPNALAVQASRLLAKPKIALRVAELRAPMEAALQREVLRGAADIARAAWAIVEDADSPPSAKVAALNLEARRYREYSDKQEVSGPGGGPIPVEVLAAFAQMSPEQIRALAQLAKPDAG